MGSIRDGDIRAAINCVLVASALWFAVWRYAGCQVRFTDHCLVVRGVVRTQAIPWPTIRSVRAVDDRPWWRFFAGARQARRPLRRTRLRIDLTNGEHVYPLALQTCTAYFGARTERTADQINTLIAPSPDD
jgi:hypothetical protein